MAEDNNKKVDLETDERESDKISHDDFKKIEESENKKSIVKRFKNAFTKKDAASPLTSEKENSDQQNNTQDNNQDNTDKKINELNMLIDKHSGKLDMISEFQNSMNDRILDFSGSIGELRSIFVSKESFFEKIENQFAEFNEQLKEINPKAISENLTNKDLKITKLETSLSILKDKQTTLSEELTKFKEIIEKIPDFKLISKSINEIKRREDNIVKMKGYVERLTEKTESFFSELSSTSNAIKTFESRISNNENSINSIISKIDKLDVKILSKGKQDDIDSIKSDLKLIKKDLFKQNFKNMITFINNKNENQSSINIPQLDDELLKREENPPSEKIVETQAISKENNAEISLDTYTQTLSKPSFTQKDNSTELKKSVNISTELKNKSLTNKEKSSQIIDSPFGEIEDESILTVEKKKSEPATATYLKNKEQDIKQESTLDPIVTQKVIRYPVQSKKSKSISSNKHTKNIKKSITRKTKQIKTEKIGKNKHISKKKIGASLIKYAQKKQSKEEKLKLGIIDCKIYISNKKLKQARKLYDKIRKEYLSLNLNLEKKESFHKQIIDLYNLIYPNLVNASKTNKK